MQAAHLLGRSLTPIDEHFLFNTLTDQLNITIECAGF
jgi:hypothetical protein